MIRHFIYRVTFGLPKWQKIGCIGCGGAVLAATPLLAALFVVFLIIAYTYPTVGRDTQADVLERNRGGAVRTPRWASDGQSIVVNIDTAIYGVAVDGGRLWRIPSRPKGHQYSPTLMPDGQVAYLRFVPRKWPRRNWQFHLVTTGIDGNGTKILDEVSILRGLNPTIPALSPNGSVIAYHADVYLADQRDDERVIRLTSIDGANSSDISLARHLVSYQNVAWSNDSKMVLAAYYYPTDRLESIDVESGQRKILVEKGTHQIFSPAWSVDDSRIYFSQRNYDTDAYSLVSVTKHGTDERLIFELDPYWVTLDIQISPENDDILLTAFQFQEMIDHSRAAPILLQKLTYLIDQNGANPRVIISDDVTDSDLTDYSKRYPYTHLWPSWSSTGERIAVYNDDPDDAVVLYTMSPDGGDAQILIRRDDDGDLLPGYGEPFGTATGASGVIPVKPGSNYRQAN